MTISRAAGEDNERPDGPVRGWLPLPAVRCMYEGGVIRSRKRIPPRDDRTEVDQRPPAPQTVPISALVRAEGRPGNPSAHFGADSALLDAPMTSGYSHDPRVQL